jgi:hypothetical protein
MTGKELKTICRANGIPPLIYNWKWADLEGNPLHKKITPVLEDLEGWIRGRNILYIYFQKDSVLASRVGATFFKKAIVDGFMGSRYTTPEWIAGYRREDWYEEGDVYSTLVNADFLIVDKVKHKMEDWQRKIWDTFVEERLAANKSTIFVGLVPHNRDGVFDDRAVAILKSLNAKVLTEDGKIGNVKQ